MIQIATKYIRKRGPQLRRFVRFINDNYRVPHKVTIKVVNYPCVFDYELNPAFGVFYPDKRIIMLANQLEFYSKEAGVNRNNGTYFSMFLLHTAAHEIWHYFQLRDDKPLKENWVDRQSSKLLVKFFTEDKIEQKTARLSLKDLEESGKIDSWFTARDPLDLKHRLRDDPDLFDRLKED